MPFFKFLESKIIIVVCARDLQSPQHDLEKGSIFLHLQTMFRMVY